MQTLKTYLVRKKEGRQLDRLYGSCLIDVFFAQREQGSFSSLTVSVGCKCRGFGIPALHIAAYPWANYVALLELLLSLSSGDPNTELYLGEVIGL